MEFLIFEPAKTHCQIILVYLNNVSHIFLFYLGPTISFNAVNRSPKFSETDFNGEWNK